MYEYSADAGILAFPGKVKYTSHPDEEVKQDIAIFRGASMGKIVKIQLANKRSKLYILPITPDPSKEQRNMELARKSTRRNTANTPKANIRHTRN